jgi:hypothetical protein
VPGLVCHAPDLEAPLKERHLPGRERLPSLVVGDEVLKVELVVGAGQGDQGVESAPGAGLALHLAPVGVHLPLGLPAAEDSAARVEDLDGEPLDALGSDLERVPVDVPSRFL